MKQFLFFLLCIFPAFIVYAQSNYPEAIQQGDAAFNSGQYKTALNKYFVAEAFDPTKKEIVKEKINKVFDKIEQLREDAINSKEQSILAIQGMREAEQAKIQVLNALKVQNIKTDSALTKARKLIDAFYFYKERFALAFRHNAFYFIDKNGDKVGKLGEWVKAEQFDFNTGLAKVQSSMMSATSPGNFRVELSEYLLDTFGTTIKAAYDVKDLDTSIKALELFNKKLRKVPPEVFSQQQLQFLDLRFNQIDSMPATIINLKELNTLNASFNRLKTLPPEILELKNLTCLVLSNNLLNALPSDIDQLKNLTTLVLRYNRLTRLPDQIAGLKNLKELNLQLNLIPINEQDRIRKLLPNCHIEF